MIEDDRSGHVDPSLADAFMKRLDATPKEKKEYSDQEGRRGREAYGRLRWRKKRERFWNASSTIWRRRFMAFSNGSGTAVSGRFWRSSRRRTRHRYSRFWIGTLVYRWDSGTIGEAPETASQVAKHLGGLMSGRLLLLSDPADDVLIYCAWWPWGNGQTISIRIGLFSASELDEGRKALTTALTGWFKV